MSDEAQVMSASVSLLESFRWWKQSDQDWAWFIVRLSQPKTPEMEAGTAFHKMLAAMEPGSFREREVDGFTFNFEEFEGTLAFGGIFEHPCSRTYGDLLVRGRADEVLGNCVTDFKLTFSSFDAEKYMESAQWRFYLDMLGKDVFRYEVFMAYAGPDSYSIRQMHSLTLYRYPELHRDCCKLAAEFSRAAIIHPEICKFRNADVQEELC